MILLLLSILILIAQAYLGMAEWWVLGSNWLLAGLISYSMTVVLSNQRLIQYNDMRVAPRIWVVLASTMNLAEIHFESPVSPWKLDMMLIGYVALSIIGLYYWQSKQSPIRALCMGGILGCLFWVYAPLLLWIMFPILTFAFCTSWSKHNLSSLITGILTSIWLVYILGFFVIGEERANAYLASFVSAWGRLSYSLPTIKGEGYTGWIYLGGTLLIVIQRIIAGLLVNSFNSLRARSNISLQCTLGIFFIVAMPICWPLGIILISFVMLMLFLLTFNENSPNVNKRLSQIVIGFFLFLGIGEYLIMQLISYIRTIDFPFDYFSFQ